MFFRTSLYSLFFFVSLDTMCGNVPPVVGGSISNGYSRVGSTRSVNCQSGYELEGNHQIECDSSGQWSRPGNCRKISDVRLVGSTSNHNGEGYILIRQHDGNWGTICDDSFQFKEAQVVCHILGYEFVTISFHLFFDLILIIQFSLNEFQPIILYGTDHVNFHSVSNYSIYLDEVQCIGNETNLLQCENSGAGIHNCNNNEKVAIRCSPKGLIRI